MRAEVHRAGRAVRLASFTGVVLLLGACATWQAPTDPGDASLRARALSQQKYGVRLSATVLGPEDSLRMFGADVTKGGVQPVWIEVENGTDHFLWLLRSGTDPDYFSALEVAWSAHATLGGKANERIDAHFERLAFPNPIPSRSTSSGVLFTNPQPVTKLLNVDLLGNRTMVPFTLLLPVPGDHESGREVLQSYDESEIARYDDPDALRKTLEALPCCATTADQGVGGEPINVIMIGNLDDIAAAANRRGYRRSAETAAAQRLFGRPPDFVSRKNAQGGAPAHWMRVWRAPITYRGQTVLLAQAGRPVGGRFAAGDLDHGRLYPDVDEVRNLVIQDFMYSGGLEQLAFVTGVGAVPEAQPRATTGGGHYHTDGLRAVLFLTTRPLTFSDVAILDWEPTMHEMAVEAAKETSLGNE